MDIIDGTREVESIVLRNKDGDDVFYIGKEELINQTGLKVIVNFTDGFLSYRSNTTRVKF